MALIDREKEARQMNAERFSDLTSRLVVFNEERCKLDREIALLTETRHKLRILLGQSVGRNQPTRTFLIPGGKVLRVQHCECPAAAIIEVNELEQLT